MASHTNDNLHYDISELVRSDLRERIPPPVVTEILSSPPFVSIPGAINVRDISSTRTAHNIRQGFAYRSGALTKNYGFGNGKVGCGPWCEDYIRPSKLLGERKTPQPRNPRRRDYMATLCGCSTEGRHGCLWQKRWRGICVCGHVRRCPQSPAANVQGGVYTHQGPTSEAISVPLHWLVPFLTLFFERSEADLLFS